MFNGDINGPVSVCFQGIWKIHFSKYKEVCSKVIFMGPCPPPPHHIHKLSGRTVSVCSHSAVNSARRALSAYLPLRDGFSVGSHPDICRLVKGVCEERPLMPKYSSTWVVKTVLDYLDALPL